MDKVALVSAFGDEPLEEVALGNAPLLRVLVQVRFPRLVTMLPPAAQETVTEFLKLLGNEYPIFAEELDVQLTMTPEGVAQNPAGKLWRLRNSEETWQVTLGDAFVSLETKAYVSRADFAQRLRRVLDAVAKTVNPPFAERVGVRYTNRIEDPDVLANLSELVRPEVLGGAAVGHPAGVSLVHSLSEALYNFEGNRNLHVRWGFLPPGAVIDPTLPAPLDNSWMLDLDCFTTDKVDFDSADLASLSENLASSNYRYFRWVVTPQFLAAFGGAA